MRRFGRSTRWAPKEPPHTCPSIDRMQSRLRTLADKIEEAGSEMVHFSDELREAAKELEQVRTENIRVREWGHEVIDEATSKMDDLEQEVADAKEAAR